MTTDQIDERIVKFQKEAEILQASYEATVRRYNESVNNSVARINQIKGAIAELEYMKTQLNGAQPT